MSCFCISRKDKRSQEEEEYLKPRQPEGEPLTDTREELAKKKMSIWEKVDSSLEFHAFVRFAKEYAKDDLENNLLFKAADPQTIPKRFRFQGYTHLKVYEDKDNHDTVFKLESKLTPDAAFVYHIKSVADLALAFVFINRLLEKAKEDIAIEIDIAAYTKKIDWLTKQAAEQSGKLLAESGSPIRFSINLDENINELAVSQFTPFIKVLGKNLKSASAGPLHLSLLKGFQVDDLRLLKTENDGNLDIASLFAINAKDIDLRHILMDLFYVKSFPPQPRTEFIKCGFTLDNRKADFFEKAFQNIAKSFPNLQKTSHFGRTYFTGKDTTLEKSVEVVVTNINEIMGRTPYSTFVHGEFIIKFEAGNKFDKATELFKKSMPDIKPIGARSDDDGIIYSSWGYQTDKLSLDLEIMEEQEEGALNEDEER